MIKGLGTDITKVERIRLLMERSGAHLLDHLLAEDERKFCSGTPEHVAGRWAAKEAVAKALGCGFGADCAVTDIHVFNDGAGRPYVTLTGAARKRAEQLGITGIFLSITHEKEYAAATVVLEG